MWTSILSVILFINELMASNAGSVMSPAVNFDSWIELYNPTNQSVDLSGMYLSNDPGNPTLWQMPAGMGNVPAKGFRVVWLGSDYIKDNQAPFKLDCDGGFIGISDRNGELITSVDYVPAMSRTSYARTTDGGDVWRWTSTPTPGSTNTVAVFATERLEVPVVSQGSQLFTGTLNVRVNIPEGATLMYTTDGSLPQAPQSATGGTPSEPWINWVRNSDCEGDDATCLVGKDGDVHGQMITTFVDGAGYKGSRGIKVHSVANPEHEWDSQFFVYTPDHIWNAGDAYRFHMRIRADKACRISAQTQTTPGHYLYWTVLDGNYNVGPEWLEISYEGVISQDQVGGSGSSEMQTIAFHLNHLTETDNNYYIDDVSWESYQGEGTNAGSSKQSSDGQFAVTGTTNYTFRLFRDGYLPSIPVTRSYLQTDNHYTLPVISIVGDRKYFTDPKIGIDCDGDGTNGIPGNGQDEPRNYNMDWDRPVNFSYLSPDGKMLFNQDVNISVSGGWTRSQQYRSFKLKSNKVFDGQNRFDYSFFPQKPYIRNKALLVRNGGNDVWSHNARFLDPALQTIVYRSGLDVDVQSYQPVIEYVNGKLRGVLNLRETNNDKFVYANWGYDDEEIDMFENFEFKQGDDGVLRRIFELGKQINDPGAYDELQTLLDIDEFTNYMAVEMFLGNSDWPQNNMKGYRSQSDGRYRFVCFDLDYTFGMIGSQANDDPFTYIKQKNYMDFIKFFLRLMENDVYRKKFIDTFCIVGGSVFEPNRAGQIVGELLDVVQPMCQLMKQQGISTGHDPDRAANTIYDQLAGRSDRLTSCMRQSAYMQLSGATKQHVRLSADTEGARLMVNGINVPYAAFDGHLFAPVKLTANAPAGYRFTGWKSGGTVVSTASTIDLPQGSVTLTACFTPLDAGEQLQQGVTPVCVNEVSAANEIYVNDYFKRNDWVELYNTTDAPVDVAGMYLTDKKDKPKKYKISGASTQGSTIIPAHGYLVVWCDKLDPLSQLHASFKLGAEGGDVMLTAADESWSNTLTYPEHLGDQTVGRYPDGTVSVYVMNIPTIAKSNLMSSYMINTKAGTRGDVNGDGGVDVGDVMAIINFMAGQPNGVTLDRADVNGDGTVDVGDVMAVINIMAE